VGVVAVPALNGAPPCCCLSAIIVRRSLGKLVGQGAAVCSGGAPGGHGCTFQDRQLFFGDTVFAGRCWCSSSPKSPIVADSIGCFRTDQGCARTLAGIVASAIYTGKRPAHSRCGDILGEMAPISPIGRAVVRTRTGGRFARCCEPASAAACANLPGALLSQQGSPRPGDPQTGLQQDFGKGPPPSF